MYARIHYLCKDFAPFLYLGDTSFGEESASSHRVDIVSNAQVFAQISTSSAQI
jgi:hypothetical protein